MNEDEFDDTPDELDREAPGDLVDEGGEEEYETEDDSTDLADDDNQEPELELFELSDTDKARWNAGRSDDDERD